MNMISEQREKHYFEAIKKLRPLDWIPLGDCLFFKNGKVYDLSAADLDKIDEIEREGKFVIAE
jgi:hypothetical protein